MKKLTYIGGFLLLLIALTACTSSTNSNSETSTDKKIQTSVVEGIRIFISNPQKEKKTEGDKEKKLYTFHIKGKNVSSETKGLGSIDFVLETSDGKELSVDPEMATFGDELKPSKTISGPASFSLEKQQKPKKIIYKARDKKMAEWKVNE